ncbi:hypothetical protein NDU88_002049 [Pleurodeles waltl]|uniref:Uncharacterized protein n=1 Tax=Pleurodeles waltl TaxID=8319 RepID=A0AAV7VBV1_PLEWA|nr:hypothetical protein NDU88_002049 [Pleurodeles waltl]
MVLPDMTSQVRGAVAPEAATRSQTTLQTLSVPNYQPYVAAAQPKIGDIPTLPLTNMQKTGTRSLLEAQIGRTPQYF